VITFPKSLSEQRRLAAERSEGISSDAIYRVIRDAIRERGLRGTILDYGAGRGELTRSLLNLGAFDRICGVDLMAVPADLLDRVEWIEQDLNAQLPYSDEEFDVVVAGTAILSTPTTRAGGPCWRC